MCSGDGKASAQEIEPQVVITAHERRDLPPEERDLFGAIHPVDSNGYGIGIYASLRRANLLRSTYWYSDGTTNKVSNVDVTSPPITTVASGLCTSAPAP